LSQEIVPPGDWSIEDHLTLVRFSVLARLYVAPSTGHHDCRTLGDFGACHRGETDAMIAAALGYLIWNVRKWRRPLWV
jgi:hypothetical protein